MMFKSLKSKFIVAFIGIELLFLSLIVGLNFSTLNRASDNLIAEKIATSLELFSQLVKAPIAISDLATLDDAVVNMGKQKNIIAIRIVNNEGLLLSEYIKTDRINKGMFVSMQESGEEDHVHDDFHYIYRQVPINFETDPIGLLSVVFETTESVLARKDNTLFTMMLITLFILVSFFVSDFIAGKVVASLQRLNRIAQSVADDKNIEIPDVKNESDEIATLFQSMHVMQNNIAGRNKRLNQTVNALQQFIRAIDESAIVSKTTPDGIITFANKKFCEVSGFTINEILGKTHNIIRHEDNDDAFFKHMWETIQAKKIYHHTIKNRNKKGQTYYVDATIVPLLNTKHEIKEYIAIRYDITDLVESKNRAIAAEQAKDAFLSNMSHEIRTPLNAILGFVHLLQKEVREEKSKSYLEVIEGSSETLLHIINDILDFSKIQSGKFQIESYPFNLLKEMALALKLFSAKALEKQITFIARVDPNLPTCMEGDLVRIKQILFNFLSNAFKFTPESGLVQVRVSYDEKSHMLNLCVEDSGIGIDTEKQEKIFTAFEQADTTTTRKFGGTGLGLSISAELAKLMHGSVAVDSRKQSGSTFSLHLPTTLCESKPVASKSYDDIKVAILKEQKEHPLLQTVIYYLEALHIDYNEQEDVIDESDSDLLIFVSDPALDKRIHEGYKHAVAIVPFESQSFRGYEHIQTLVTPFTSIELCALLDKNIFTAQERSQGIPEEKKSYKGRILICEDNKTNQMLISLLLDEYGLDYMIANDGVEAVEKFKEGSFDLVLMDENMPNKNGLEALADIRSLEKEQHLKETPVIALTANALVHDKERFFEAGMNDFLAKPIDIDELERVLEFFLSK